MSHLHNHLIRAGEQAAVLTSEPDRKLPRVHATMPQNWTVAQLGRALDAIGKLQPTIVHIQYPAAGYRHGMVALLPWAIKRRFPQIKICITFHELHRERWRSKLESFLAAGAADAIIFPMHYDHLYFRARAGHARRWDDDVPVVTIPVASGIPCRPAIGRSEMRQRLQIANDDVVLAFFGFVRPDKQVEVLLEAFERLLPIYSGLHLALYADFTDAHRDDETTLQYRRSLQPVVARLQARTSRLHQEGYIEDPRLLSSALLASDIGVLPFRNGVYETSTVLMAMLSHGLPVISTASQTAPPDLNRAIYLAQTNDAAGVASAISTLIEQPDERARLQQAARMWIQSHDWPEVVQKHLSLYAGLLPTYAQ